MTGKDLFLLKFIAFRPALMLVLTGRISKEAPAFKEWLSEQNRTDHDIIIELLKLKDAENRSV